MIDTLMLGDEKCEFIEEAKGWESIDPCKAHQPCRRTLGINWRDVSLPRGPSEHRAKDILSILDSVRSPDSEMPSPQLFFFSPTSHSFKASSNDSLVPTSPSAEQSPPNQIKSYSFGFGQHWIFVGLTLSMSILLIGAWLVLRGRISWNVLKASSV